MAILQKTKIKWIKKKIADYTHHMNIINRCFGMTHSMKSENKFAFYVSLYYLRVRRLYASVYLPTTESNSVYLVHVCVCLMSIHLFALQTRYYYIVMQTHCVHVIIWWKIFPILDPHHLYLYKSTFKMPLYAKLFYISNENERRIGNSKYKKKSHFFALHIMKKKIREKNSHTRRTHICHLPLL